MAVGLSKGLLGSESCGGEDERAASKQADSFSWLAFDAFASLLRAAQAGDATALERFCASVRPLVLEFVSRHVPPSRVEDITQEIMMRIGRAYSRIEPGDCGQFIITVARNETKREKRRLMRSPAALALKSEPIERAVESPSAADTPADALDAGELRQTVRAACLRLPTADMRRLALLLFVEGVDRSDLAREFGVSGDVLRARLHRVRELLRCDMVLVSYLCPHLVAGGAPMSRAGPQCNQQSPRLFQPPPSNAQLAS